MVRVAVNIGRSWTRIEAFTDQGYAQWPCRFGSKGVEDMQTII